MIGGVIGTDAYVKARKLGLKAYHNSLQKHLNTSLPVLEEINPQLNTLGRVSLGLVQVPLTKVVGTASKGRTNAFAPNLSRPRSPGCCLGAPTTR